MRRVEVLTKNHTPNTSSIPTVDLRNSQMNASFPKINEDNRLTSSRKPSEMITRKPTFWYKKTFVSFDFLSIDTTTSNLLDTVKSGG